jgi:PAS domain S-box-containing protein
MPPRPDEPTLKQRLTSTRSSEDRFQLFVSTVKDYAIVIVGETGMIEIWNIGAEHLTGFTSADVLNKHISILYGGKSADALSSASHVLEEVRKLGRLQQEGWRVRKDGSSFWADTVTIALHDELGNIRGFAEITRDLTERRRYEHDLLTLNATLEKQVEDRTAELKHMNNELEAFSYSVSHDLRAPLRAIDGFAQALMEDYGPNLAPDLKNYLDRICHNATKMGGLIDDLLAFSRIGRMNLSYAAVDMRQLFELVFAEVKSSEPDRDIELKLDDLPAAEVDYNLIKHVITNLLSNSVKFTRTRAKAIIEVDAKRDEKAYTFSVKDNGVGFDMRFASKLFAPFQRLHRTNEFEGSGIGLALCQRIIIKHKGTIKINSHPKEGTIVTCTLPLRQGDYLHG